MTLRSLSKMPSVPDEDEAADTLCPEEGGDNILVNFCYLNPRHIFILLLNSEYGQTKYSLFCSMRHPYGS